MRHRRTQEAALTVSLFPFLAVLICTMGVLIVMLVLAVKSSAVKARNVKLDHTSQVQQERDQLLDQIDFEEIRIDQISAMRDGVKARLEEQKLRRSHLDDEIRKLMQQAETLKSSFQQLTDDQSLASDTVLADQSKIDDLQRRIEQRKTEVSELRNNVADRPLMYSIVPTRTSGGTNRRPIYVECTPSGIRLQPEGIEISISEFTQPVIAGNPLDAALLATREYWNKYDAGSNQGEPYPLLVIRPGGASAYALARRAMTSWDDEFGYELVESEKQLDWGPVDQNLATNVRQAIAISMKRQQTAVAANQVEWIGGPGSRIGNSRESDQVAGMGRSSTEDQLGSGRRMRGDGMGGDGMDGKFKDSSGDIVSSGNGGTSQNKALGALANSNNVANDDPLVQGSGFGGVSNETSSGSGSGSATSSDQTDGLSRFEESNNQVVAESGKRNPLRRNDPAAFGGQQMTGAESGNVSAMSNSINQIQPLSQLRGQDWALPTRTPGATAYRRPIRVECDGDHYVVHSGDPSIEPARVPIIVDSDSDVDELVNEIWKQIEAWGMAEIGGYWKPVLRLSTIETGSRAAEELARKLDGSGVEIERQWR